MVNVQKLYITPEDVRGYMNVDWDTGTFSDENLIKRIIRAMENVDFITATTWNGRIKKIKEVFDMGKWKDGFLIGRGIPIVVSRENIKEVLSLKVLFGNTYKEYVNDTNAWTYIESGKIYLKVLDVDWGGDEIMVEYTYGQDILPENVKELTLLYVVREILMFEQFITELPSNAQAGIDWKTALQYINDRIDYLEDMLSQPKFASQIIYDVDTE